MSSRAGVPRCACLACGVVHDNTTCLDDDVAGPEPGHLTICTNCGHVMAFDENLMFRELNTEEREKADRHPIISRSVEIIEHMKKQRAETKSRRLQ